MTLLRTSNRGLCWRVLVLPLPIVQLAVNSGAGAGLVLQRRGGCIPFVATLQSTEPLLPSGIALKSGASDVPIWQARAIAHCPCRAQRVAQGCVLLGSELNPGANPRPVCQPRAPDKAEGSVQGAWSCGRLWHLGVALGC